MSKDRSYRPSDSTTIGTFISAPAPAKPVPPLLVRLRRAYASVSAPAPAKPVPPLFVRLRRAYASVCSYGASLLDCATEELLIIYATRRLPNGGRTRSSAGCTARRGLG